MALTTLLLACSPQLAGSEKQSPAEGYKHLNAWAYIRERPDGHGLSSIYEGELGEAAILTYLRNRMEKADEALKAMTAAGADSAEVRRLEARKASAQRTLDLMVSAGRLERSSVTR
ncbi:hypothetical protein DAETH_19620 [Deinococcus aetherius]|uniref:Uncharacterized protein n=2 Tax=Deinococcus aetherius TaxID=200252 RepID=A0ABN6RJ11_9DEIO|nr:hypothetical protein [Deinococcus aetherius]BDP41993.1 hypothetical protein DAETH_19620 [Deinococcus aetherius]